jgi:hypothetical protein
MNALKYDSFGFDRITVKMLKLNIHYLSEPLLYIFNLVVTMSTVPDNFKILVIITIHKKVTRLTLKTIVQSQKYLTLLIMLKNL